jgi:nitroreductase
MVMQQTMKTPVDALRWRYATKKFDSNKKISADTWKQIQDAMLLTPSSYGLQPWKFVVVTDQSVKEKLVPVAMGQRQPADCSHFIVICRLDQLSEQHVNDYVNDMAAKRGAPPESLQGFRDLLQNFRGGMPEEKLADWMSRQCYIALGNLMTSAALLGVDNGPMEGFDKEKMDEALDLPAKGARSVVCCALGYRDADDKYSQMAKVRFDASRVFINV